MDGLRRYFQRRIQYVIAFGGFLDLLAVALILPPLASHLKSLGLASWQRGFVLSSYGVLQFVSGPVIGALSDSGDRKKVFLICVICSAFSYSLLGLSSSSLLWALLARALAGVFKHSQTLSKALLCDDDVTVASPASSFTSSESGASRPAALARFNGASSVGFIVGPIIGGHVLQAFPGAGFAICCQMAAALFVFNAVLMHLCLAHLGGAKEETLTAEAVTGTKDVKADDGSSSLRRRAIHDANINNRDRNSQGDDNYDHSGDVKKHGMRDNRSVDNVVGEDSSSSSIRSLVRNLSRPFAKIGEYHVWDLFLAKFLGGCSVLVFRYDINQRLTEFYGATPQIHGYVTSYGAVAAAFFSTFIVDRVSSSYHSNETATLLLHTTLLHVVALTCLSLAPNLPLFTVGITLMSFTNASNRVTYTQITIDRGGGKASAGLIGLCQSVSSMARIASPILGGFIQDSFLGLGGPPMLAIGLAVASASVAKICLVPEEKKKTAHRKDE